MNRKYLWRAATLAATIFIPMGTYSLKSKQCESWVWGSGRNGELGIGSENNSSLPQNLKNHRFVEIDAGKSISVGITKEGKLFTWGKNRSGVLGHEPPNVNVLLPRVVSSIDKVVQVSCGYQNICAVTQSGEAFIWGINEGTGSFRRIGRTETSREIQTQVKPVKININNVKQVSCAGEYTAVVNQEGKVFIFGTSNVRGVANTVSKSNSDIIQLDISEKIKKVESGPNFSMALSENGKVYVWGNNNFGQLGTGSLLSLNKPQLLESLAFENVSDISCGDNFSGAVTKNGDVYTWGFGNEGQLGHGDKSDQLLPRKVQFHEKIQKISCGGAHTALLTVKGKLFMMGRGREGQLGRFYNDEGNSGYSLKIKPVEQLPQEKAIFQVSCGSTHSIVLLESLL